MVAQSDGLAQGWKILALVLGANIHVPVFGRCEIYPRAMPNIQRFADVGDLFAGSEHSAGPGRACAVSAGNQNWRRFIIPRSTSVRTRGHSL